MSFDVKEFRDSGLPCGGARPSLFEVIFHALGETDAKTMAFLACSVKTKMYRNILHDNVIELGITILEREDGFVADHLSKLDGPITVREYGKMGNVTRETKYDFRVQSIENQLDWDMTNKIKTYEVQGIATVRE